MMITVDSIVAVIHVINAASKPASINDTIQRSPVHVIAQQYTQNKPDEINMTMIPI